MMKKMLAMISLSALPLASALAASEPETNQAATTAESEAAALRQACGAAIQQYRAALKANPKDAVSYNLMGTCHQRLGQEKAAKKAYQRAIKLDPSYAQAYNNLATIFHAQGNYRRAVEQYRAAIAQNPGIAVAHRNLGTALLAMSRTEDGFAALSEAQRLDPTILDSVGAITVGVRSVELSRQYFYFAKIAARAGQVDVALEFLRKARATGFADFAKVRNDPDFGGVVPDRRFATLAN